LPKPVTLRNKLEKRIGQTSLMSLMRKVESGEPDAERRGFSIWFWLFLFVFFAAVFVIGLYKWKAFQNREVLR
jgi:hypothetical protein